ncbi:MAG: DeoR/GlpR transcriptional regulator [Solobacterium sp.]|nr:DeoR/GlpR transcriptional regulator [Solobacterium sp.]
MKVSKNIVDQRREDIMKAIQENNFMSVEDLVNTFHVSPVTIRRDLQYWEDKGAIERTYGGAALLQAFIDEDEATYERNRYMKGIAKRAALMVEDGDVIFINSSMTALMLINYIRYKNVTIITNNARAINYDPDPNVTILFTGGEVRFPKKSITGDIAIATLNSITADKCFIGCSGLDKEAVTTGYMKETKVNHCMLQRTKGKRVLLCDHTKVGLSFSFQYSDYSDIHTLITDVEANEEIMDYLEEEYHLEIIKVEPAKRG